MTPSQFKSDMISMLPRMRRFAISLTWFGPDADADADDLLQDACSAALQQWQTYDPALPFDRWLFRIMRNRWFSEVCKRKVRPGKGHVPAEDAIELQTDPNADEIMTARHVDQTALRLNADLSPPLLLVCAEGYSYGAS